MTSMKALLVILAAVLVAPSHASGQTTISLSMTQSSSQIPGTLGTGTGSANCPNTVINTAATFTVSLPSQYHSIAAALADGYFFNGTGIGSGSGTSYQNGDRCDATPRSVGPETYSVRFDRNTLAIQGIPDNIGVGPVNPNGNWHVSPTAITYSGPYYQQFNGPAIGTMSFSITGDIGVAGVDVSVTSVTAIQSVAESSIPLIAGKSAVARISGHIEEAKALAPTDTLSFLVFVGGTSTAVAHETHTIADLKVDAQGNFATDVAFTPTVVGSSVPLTVEIFPLADEDQTDNNFSAPLLLRVKAAKGLYLAFIKMDGSNCLGDVADYGDTVSESSALVAGMFPVPASQLTIDRVGRLPFCTTPGSYLDYSRLFTLGNLYAQGRPNRIIGVASDAYMDAGVGLNTAGGSWCGGSVIFLRHGTWEALGHELGHTYQLSNPDRLEDACDLPPIFGAPSRGFWVDEREPINLDSVVGDQPAAQPSRSMMGDGPDGAFPKPNGWITPRDYEFLFGQLAIDPTDPALLLVTGAVHRDGRVDWAPLYQLPTGIVDDSGPGDYAVQVLDAVGNVLSRTTFGLNFSGPREVGQIVNADVVPFGLKVPYSQGTETVQLTHGSQVISQVSVGSTLLRDVVKALPDAAFVSNAPQLRNALLNKIDAFERQSSPQPTVGARQKLLNDIRKQLADWLIAGYPVDSPLEYTKEQVLGLVDELVQRLP